MAGLTQRHDAVVVGGGHNGLVAATLLARAGFSVVVLERSDELGGAAVSRRLFDGVDARVSCYSYLVSLFPPTLLRSLGLGTGLRERQIAAYTPDGEGGLLARRGTSSPLTARVAGTLTEPLRSREEFRACVGDERLWEAVFERPLGGWLEREFDSDLNRGVVLTDALIGTFTSAGDPTLKQNRCFLYHVIGGSWRVPVGGMGALTGALAHAAAGAGVVLRTSARVSSIETDGSAAAVRCEDGTEYLARHVLAGVAPAVLARLLGTPLADDAPEGSQLKLNLLLSRLPRLRDASVDPADAFTGTFHVNEGYEQLQRAHDEAASGRIPSLPPCELYCHSLTDPTILGPGLRATGAHTLTVFGLHMPARLFRDDPDAARERAVAATVASIDSVLAEPLADCLYRTPAGEPCLDAHTPVDLERELAMPGGHIFHRDLAWPFAERDEEVGRWGVETSWPNVWLCGAGARRGGGVSGIPGHNAAQAVLAAGR